MSKVTRIVYSRNLNQGKYEHLLEMARLCGCIRREVWQRYGSIAGAGLTHRDVRAGWLAEGREFDLPARIWKQTLSDVGGRHGCLSRSGQGRSPTRGLATTPP